TNTLLTCRHRSRSFEETVVSSAASRAGTAGPHTECSEGIFPPECQSWNKARLPHTTQRDLQKPQAGWRPRSRV
ncbi:hypothetical protein Hamer_G018852, partial [Homarus americanus]